MIVIGTFAYCGSGQDAIARLISPKLDFPLYSMGDIVRNIAKKNNLGSTRQNLQDIRREYDTKYGRSYFADILAREIESRNTSAIITGIRLLEEVEMFKKYFGNKFYLVFVYADEFIRFNRLLKRNEEKDPKNYSEFLIQMENEKKLFDLERLERQYDLQIDCNMTLKKMEDGIESIMSEFYFLHEETLLDQYTHPCNQKWE